jgi:hypothetical protein
MWLFFSLLILFILLPARRGFAQLLPVDVMLQLCYTSTRQFLATASTVPK